jgi:predicted nucleic acid-binding protein
LNAYLDSSVLLREILEQTPRLREWYDLIVGVTSELARVECLRTIDRLRHEGKATDENVAEAQDRIDRLFKRLLVAPLDVDVLTRASEPLPTSLSTLDAIHLATAMIYRATEPDDEPPMFFATFDRALAKAAHATGFRVLGATP